MKTIKNFKSNFIIKNIKNTYTTLKVKKFMYYAQSFLVDDYNKTQEGINAEKEIYQLRSKVKKLMSKLNDSDYAKMSYYIKKYDEDFSNDTADTRKSLYMICGLAGTPELRVGAFNHYIKDYGIYHKSVA